MRATGRDTGGHSGCIRGDLEHFWLQENVSQILPTTYLRVRVLRLLEQPQGHTPSTGSFLMLLLWGLLFLECSEKAGPGGIGHVSKTARYITAWPISDKVLLVQEYLNFETFCCRHIIIFVWERGNRHQGSTRRWFGFQLEDLRGSCNPQH